MFSCLFVILMMMVTISASHSARACYSVVVSETFLGPPVEDHVSKDAQLAEPGSCFRTPKDNQPNSHTEKHLTGRHGLWPKTAPARAPPHSRLCLHTSSPGLGSLPEPPHVLWPLPGSAYQSISGAFHEPSLKSHSEPSVCQPAVPSDASLYRQ